MRLATKIIASSLAIIVLLTAVASYFSVRNKYHEFELAQRKLATATAMAIRQGLNQALQNKDFVDVVQFLEDASRESKGALRIRWVWLDESATPGERPRIAISPEDLPIGEAVAFVAETDSGQRSLFTYVPLQLSLSRPGALEFTESLAPLEQQMWRDGLLTLALIGVIALASIVTAYLAGINWVAKPLEKLIAKTQRIGQGDFDSPLLLNNRDELGQLASALNEMCSRLEQQKTELANEAGQRLTMLDQLRHADRLKTVGRLAAGVGHELGTPLNVIAGRANLIAGGKLNESQVVESAHIIKDEADRVTGIVRQLLDFARRRPPQRTSMDLRKVLERTIELLQPIAERSSTQIQFECPPASDDSSSFMTNADPGQLQQVFTNIIVNAIQAMPNGGKICISLSVAESNHHSTSATNPHQEYWKISVSDNGVGIPPEHLDHVFEPFYTTRDVNEGTGLGLSIAYGIVQEHDGWIEVASRVGEGSRFDVFLPKGNA